MLSVLDEDFIERRHQFGLKIEGRTSHVKNPQRKANLVAKLEAEFVNATVTSQVEQVNKQRSRGIKRTSDGALKRAHDKREGTRALALAMYEPTGQQLQSYLDLLVDLSEATELQSQSFPDADP